MPLAGSWPRGFALGRFFSMIIMMMIMMILLMMMLIIIRGLAAAVDQKGDSVQLLGLAQGGKVEALGQVVDTGICEIIMITVIMITRWLKEASLWQGQAFHLHQNQLLLLLSISVAEADHGGTI